MYFKEIAICVISIVGNMGIEGFGGNKAKPFTFPGQNEQPSGQQPPPPPAATAPNNNVEVLARQLISGTVGPSVVNNPFTCICVPTGQCPSAPNDGTGQIDVRIVNNPGSSPTPSVPCATGLVICCQAGPYQCGVRYPPVAGSLATTANQAPFGAYPWQAAILTSGDVYLGSGALISRRHILTAAHKINGLPINTYKVRLGEWDAAATTEPLPAQEFAIGSVTIHPAFNANNLQNNVAILTLATEVNLGQYPTIATACLPGTSFDGRRCFVSGWGKNDFGPNGQYQAIQKQVDVPVRSAAECQSALANTRLGPTFVFNSNSFICAGGEPGKDACTGDGGSPLVCDLNSRWFVAGLVAWGIGCATSGVPGVYVNVATYVPWIQTIINS